MKKITPILLGLALVMTLAACGAKKADQPADQTGGANQQADENFSGSIDDLIARKIPSKCTYQSVVGETKQSGTVYIQGANARTYLEMAANGETLKMNALKVGDWQYMWNEGMMTGNKINMVDPEFIALQKKYKDQAAEQKGTNVDFGAKMNLKCRVWVPDAATFSVPTNVQFSDMTQMMKAAAQSAEGSKASICNMCGSLTGEAKDECLQACQ